MPKVFFVCPKCKGKVYDYLKLEGDGVNTWTFTCKCKCGNIFRNTYRLGDPNADIKRMLEPENMAKIVRETMGFL